MIRTFLIALIILMGVSIVAIAQDGICPTLVQQALDAIADNCGGLDRNIACYGYNGVNAAFTEPVPPDFFTQPADRTGLTTVQSIETAPLNIEADTWGVAVMSVQANVPNTLPGQAVVFLLIGDARVENAVPSDEAFIAADPVAIETTVAANIRSGPSLNHNVIASAPPGTPLEADGRSADGAWYRVVFNGIPGWVSLSTISTAAGLTELPAITDGNRSPMQAFYFNTGPGQPHCNEAPNSVVIQGPRGITVNLSVNGADISIGSTIVLTDNGDGTFQLWVLDGHAQIGELTVPAGFTITGTFDEDGNIVLDAWTDLRPMTQDELDQFQWLEGLDGILLNYQIQIPTLEDIARILAAISGGGGGIVAGGTGRSAVDEVNCTGFIPTSPIGRLPYETVGFYWNPAGGATHYQVNVYSGDGDSVVSSALVPAPQTSTAFDVAGFGGGDAFSWDVTALFNGEAACTTGRATLTRDPAPEAETPAVPITGSLYCANEYVVGFAWDNLAQGAVLTIYYWINNEPGGVVGGLTGTAGTHTFNNGGYPVNHVVFVTSDGQMVNIPGSVTCG